MTVPITLVHDRWTDVPRIYSSYWLWKHVSSTHLTHLKTNARISYANKFFWCQPVRSSSAATIRSASQIRQPIRLGNIRISTLFLCSRFFGRHYVEVPFVATKLGDLFVPMAEGKVCWLIVRGVQTGITLLIRHSVSTWDFNLRISARRELPSSYHSLNSSLCISVCLYLLSCFPSLFLSLYLLSFYLLTYLHFTYFFYYFNVAPPGFSRNASKATSKLLPYLWSLHTLLCHSVQDNSQIDWLVLDFSNCCTQVKELILPSVNVLVKMWVSSQPTQKASANDMGCSRSCRRKAKKCAERIIFWILNP